MGEGESFETTTRTRFFLTRGADSLDLLRCHSLRVQMDSGRPWGDYYVLNSAFAEAVDAEGDGGDHQSGWIDPSLVRFWTKFNGRGSKGGSGSRSVKVLESLSVSYQVSRRASSSLFVLSFSLSHSPFIFLLVSFETDLRLPSFASRRFSFRRSPPLSNSSSPLQPWPSDPTSSSSSFSFVELGTS